MKRFWTDVTVDPAGGIALDGRPVRTPGRLPLVVPSPALAAAIADEWRAVAGEIDPRAMPLTGLANAAIERVAADPTAFAAGLAVYGGSDLLCYRDGPGPLADRQAAWWDPILDWARARYTVDFTLGTGVMPVEQPPRTLAVLRDATTALSPWRLAPLSPIVGITGSLLIGLALVEGAIDADTGWAAAKVDEDWQTELWGQDDLALATRAAHEAEYRGALRFLGLL